MYLRKILDNQGQQGRAASRILALLPTEQKNRALFTIAEELLCREVEILASNADDLKMFSDKNLPNSVVLKNRLRLTHEKIVSVVEGVRQVAHLPDPVGEIFDMRTRPNGLQIGRMRVPLGVIGCIYESRPNVTVDIAALCLKSGNACMLRGGSESLRSNRILVSIIRSACTRVGVDADFLQFVDTTDRRAVEIMAGMSEYIDVIIPRGGEELMNVVTRQARMPVLNHRKGITHTFVDRTAKLDQAIKIIVNAKTSNPSTCNSLEKVLIHQDIAKSFLPALVEALRVRKVEVRGCEQSLAIVPDLVPASEEDWSTEYLDLILTVKVVESYEQAAGHIERYSTGLAEAILSEDYSLIARFVREIDSANVLVNTSTRFVDGGEYGLGAEVGISTSRLHSRGPMGLQDLTIGKYIVFGSGQIRN